MTWLGAHMIARGADGVMFESNAVCGNETFFGFEMVSDDVEVEDRSGIVGFDFGSPTPPFVNLPADHEFHFILLIFYACASSFISSSSSFCSYDTHEKVRRDERSQEMMQIFFESDSPLIVNTCEGTCN